MKKLMQTKTRLKVAALMFAPIVCASLMQAVLGAERTPPNNNSYGGSLKSNYVTSSSNRAHQVSKTATQTGQKIVTDPRRNQVVMTGTKGLPESQILLRHNELAPGLSRQQAMALESENGHLPPWVEQEMRQKGLLKNAAKVSKSSHLSTATYR